MHQAGPGQADTMGVHGMLLFGDSVLYLSHLPMFANPHNFQVLLEVGFEDGVREALTGDDLYTFVPEPFAIVELAAEPARTSMEGTIFRGHFERGGQPIGDPVVADVQRVVHFRELDSDAARAEDRELAYLCFGRAGRLHLAHEITARPDFDHLLTARLVPGTVTDQAGRRPDQDVTGWDFATAQPVLFRGRADLPEQRLAPDETIEGFFFQTTGPGGSHGLLVQVETGRELYAEVGELS